MKNTLVGLSMQKRPTDAYDLIESEMDQRRFAAVWGVVAESAIDSLFGSGSFNGEVLDEIEAPVRHPNDAMARMNPIDVHNEPNAVPGQFKPALISKDLTRMADLPAADDGNPDLLKHRAEVDQYIASRRPETIEPELRWTPDRSAFPQAVNDNDILKFYPIFRIASNLVLGGNQRESQTYESAAAAIVGMKESDALAERRELALAENLNDDQLARLTALNDAVTNASVDDSGMIVEARTFGVDGKSPKELWDEYSRRSAAHGSGSRHEVMDAIESAISRAGGPEAVRKMKLYANLRAAGRNGGAVAKLADGLLAKA